MAEAVVQPTVFSALHDVLHTLRTTYPSPTAAHLHPFATRDAGPKDASTSTAPARLDRAHLLRNVQAVRHALGQFKQTWEGELGRMGAVEQGEDPAVVVERRKGMLLRVMVDWCAQQSTYAPLQAHLDTLLSLPPRRPRTPFLHRHTTTSPTQRLVALGQALFQDAPEVNDGDPDYGMRSGEDVQVDSITFGGKRLVLEIQIRHPRTSAEGERTGWQLVEVKFSYDATGGGEDVHLPSADAVLSRSLGAYLVVLDRIGAVGHEGVDEDAPGETLALQAERAVRVFEGDLRALVVLDERMGLAGEAAPGQVDWFAEVERVKGVVAGIAEVGSHGIHLPLRPRIMPTFHLLDPASMPTDRNPAITLLPSASARTLSLEQPRLEDLHGWDLFLPRTMAIPAAALSSSDARPRRGKAGSTLEDLLLRDATGSTEPVDLAMTTWEKPLHDDDPLMQVKCLPSGTPGYIVRTQPVSTELWHRISKLRQQILLQPLFISCFGGAQAVPRQASGAIELDIDDLSAEQASPLQVTVALDQDSLRLSLISDAATDRGSRPAALTVNIRADQQSINTPTVTFSVKLLSGANRDGIDQAVLDRLSHRITWQNLQEQGGEVLDWLSGITATLRGDAHRSAKRRSGSQGKAEAADVAVKKQRMAVD